MNKYIIEILQNKSSLILPGIGALMVVNKKTGKIKINPHLTFNDGALAEFISEKEGIDKIEAQNLVSKFTRDIIKQLDKGDSYDIFEFGKIYKNEKNEITFDTFSNKLTETVVPEIKEVIKPIIEKTEITKEVEEGKEEAEIEEVDEPIKNTYIPPVNTEKEEIIDSSKKDVKPTIIKESPSKTIEVNKDEPTIENDILNKIPKKTRKKGAWVISSVLLILIITAGYFFRDSIMNIINSETDHIVIKNVNNYPDSDNDQIPDFADIDLTGGNDIDNDNIDDLADLDQTNGQDIDNDGIDDQFAKNALAEFEDRITENIDITVLADNNNNAIIDFADATLTGGVDTNSNSIDDNYEIFSESQSDMNENKIIDSLEEIAILKQVNTYFKDENSNYVPDYADVIFTEGQDINNNDIDDVFEKPEFDIDEDGIFDSAQMAHAFTFNKSFGTNTSLEPTADDLIENDEEIVETFETNEEFEDEIISNNNDQQVENEVEVSETSEEIEQVAELINSTGKFHIVGGAFGEKKNAENYVEKMTSKGYNAYIIGRFDNLHLVALKSFESVEKAKDDLNSIRSVSKSAWIFEY